MSKRAVHYCTLIVFSCCCALVIDCVQAFSFNTPETAYIKYSPNWSEVNVQRVKFKFRTTKASVHLLSHHVLSGASILADYSLHVFIKNGELFLLQSFKEYEDTITVGKALNQDEWHTVTIYKDPQRGQLHLQLDSSLSSRSLDGYRRGGALRFLRDESTHSVVVLGDDRGPKPKNIGAGNFVGCINDVFFSMGNGPFLELKPTERIGVVDGCIDLCQISDPCQNLGHCINHYVSKACDCFGTGYRGKYCERSDVLSITLRGYEWFTFAISSEHDQAHTPAIRVSVEFKTSFPDGVIFYGGDTVPHNNYIAASIQNGTMVVSVNFGEGELKTYIGTVANDDKWHNLTVLHQEKRVLVLLDQHLAVLPVQGKMYHLRLHPTFYVGGGVQQTDKGLGRLENFVGCMKNIYFDYNALLDLLSSGSRDISYRGSQLIYGCEAVNQVVMSLVNDRSRLTLRVPSRQFISIRMDFRTFSVRGLLIYAEFSALNYYNGYVEITIVNGRIRLVFSPVAVSPRQNTVLQLDQKYNDGQWHQLEFEYRNGEMKLSIDSDQKLASTKMANPEITVDTKVYIGYSTRHGNKGGFVGCLRDINIQDHAFNARKLLNTELAQAIELDNCDLKNLCRENNPCQHESLCVVEWKSTRCDCSGTGYTGKNCHFPMYMRTCDELFLSGERRSGVFPLDIDGAGPLNFTYVTCEMNVDRDGIKYGVTAITHNLERDTIVRKTGLVDMKMLITYRDFNAVELEKLWQLSYGCSQEISYNCRKAPLLLGINTWLNSMSGFTYSGFGSSTDGHCGCADTASCMIAARNCNCDSDEDITREDSGLYTHPSRIPVKEVYFLQQGVGEANLTLGDFKCWGRGNELSNAVAFGRGGEPLRVPGWTGGDRLEFWFRTHDNVATLLHHISTDGQELSIRLVSQISVKFQFSTNRGAYSITVSSGHSLNNGSWQHCMIEYDKSQTRVSLNSARQWLNFEEDEKIVSYSGMMALGGLMRPADNSPGSTMLGCIGGVFYNDQHVDLSLYLNHTENVKIGCRPRCTPNPCRHGSLCTEYWTKHRCTCLDTKLMFGTNCQIDINSDVITLHDQHAHMLFTDAFHKRYLRRDVSLSFRTYQDRALLFYLYDSLNNFLQIHIEDRSKLVLTLNQGVRIIRRTFQVYPYLNDGKWKQLHLVQKKDRLKLRLDEKETVVGVRRLRIANFMTDPYEEEESVRPFRVGTDRRPRVYILIGGVPRNVTTSLPTFYGCIRGLKIGKRIFNMSRNVFANGQGVIKDCDGGCDNSPCRNAGTCVERWNGKFVCNCSWTTYHGGRCTDEIGASFDSESVLTYTMPRQTEMDDEQGLYESFSFGFSTNTLLFEEHVLVFVSEAGDGLTKYVSVILQRGKRLLLNIYLGDAVYEIEQSGDFDDGHRHKVVYMRNRKIVTLKVDSNVVEKEIESEPLSFVPYFIMVGGIIKSQQTYRGLLLNMIKNFTGCISNLEFYSENNFNSSHRPLDVLAGVSGDSRSIVVNGRLVKAKCAPFFSPWLSSPPPPSTSQSVIDTGYVYPPWSVGSANMILLRGTRTGASLERSSVSVATIAIASCLIVIMLILAVCAALVLWRYRDKKKSLYEIDKEEEKSSLKNAAPVKPQRYVYRGGTDSLPSRLNNTNCNASQYSLFPNRYGSSGGLQYCTLPMHHASRKISPAVSRGSTLDRSLHGSSTTANGYHVPPTYSAGGSTNSMLSERSRLASIEDLTADEMDSPPPVKRRKARPTGAVFDEDDGDVWVGIPTDMYLPLMCEEKRRRRRTPSSISQVIAEMELLTNSLARTPVMMRPVRKRVTFSDPLKSTTSQEFCRSPGDSPLMQRRKSDPSFDFSRLHSPLFDELTLEELINNFALKLELGVKPLNPDMDSD